jgi:hypothetical protein
LHSVYILWGPHGKPSEESSAFIAVLEVIQYFPANRMHYLDVNYILWTKSEYGLFFSLPQK